MYENTAIWATAWKNVLFFVIRLKIYFFILKSIGRGFRAIKERMRLKRNIRRNRRRGNDNDLGDIGNDSLDDLTL